MTDLAFMRPSRGFLNTSGTKRLLLGDTVPVGASMYLGFENGLYYDGGNINFDDIITFTRASAGTYTDSAGRIQTDTTNVPRFTYQTGSRGLLLEDTATNLQRRSEDHSALTGSDTTIVEGSLSNIEAASFAKVSETATTAFHITNNENIAVTTGLEYTFSIYVKAGTRNLIQLFFSSGIGGSNAWGNFILTGSGSLGTIGSAASAVIEDVGNDVYRCSLTITTTATSSGFGVFTTFIESSTDTRIPVFLGDTANYYEIGGWQVEQNTAASSYIKTTSAAVTRAKDVFAITGTNFSTWYNATQGTFCIDQYLNQHSPNATVLGINDGTSNERMKIVQTDGGSLARLFVTDGGSTVAQIDAGTDFIGVQNKEAFAYELNNVNMSSDGVLGTVDTAVTMPTVDQLELMNQLGVAYSYGVIKELRYYNTRLSDDTIARMTGTPVATNTYVPAYVPAYA